MVRRAKSEEPFPNLSNTEFRALEAKNTTEEVFRQQLRKHAKGCGWLRYHTYISKDSDPGFPDEVFLKGSRMVVVECKRVGKEPTAIQTVWLDAFRQIAGAEVFVWTAADWDEIYAVLGVC